MTNGVLRPGHHAPHGFLRQFARARRAGAAVEFALLAPLAALGISSLGPPKAPAPPIARPAAASTIGDPAAQAAIEAAQGR